MVNSGCQELLLLLLFEQGCFIIEFCVILVFADGNIIVISSQMCTIYIVSYNFLLFYKSSQSSS